MKVLQLAKFSPLSAGGIEYVVRTYCDSLLNLGVSNSVVCFEAPAVSNNQKYEIHRCKNWITLGSQPLSLKYLYLSLKHAKSSDLLIAHAPNALSALALIVIKLLMPKKRCYVYWHADVVAKNKFQKALSYFLFPLQKCACQSADGVIYSTATYAEQSHSKKFKIRKKIYWPIVTNLKTDKKSQLKETNYIKILFVGRLVPYKGMKRFIKLLADIDIKYELNVVGSGPELLSCLKLVDKYKLNVNFHGEINSSTLRSLYFTTDILVLPSISKAEAFGVVLIEAMSYAKPLLTTKILGSGVNEVNKNNVTGLTFDLADKQTLTNALSTLQKSDVYERMSENCLSTIDTLYSQASQDIRLKQLLEE